MTFGPARSLVALSALVGAAQLHRSIFVSSAPFGLKIAYSDAPKQGGGGELTGAARSRRLA